VAEHPAYGTSSRQIDVGGVYALLPAVGTVVVESKLANVELIRSLSSGLTAAAGQCQRSVQMDGRLPEHARHQPSLASV